MGWCPAAVLARMTFAAAPDAMQGAVAAGLLVSGSVILGAFETAGRSYVEIDDAGEGERRRPARPRQGGVAARREKKQPIAGYGHPSTSGATPRVDALFQAVGARRAAASTSSRLAKVVEKSFRR
jgi:citrate synthase